MKKQYYLLFFLTTIVLFSCKKAPDHYVIHLSGKVFDAKTNLGVSGAEIRSTTTGSCSACGDIITQTDLSGNYSFDCETNSDGKFNFILTKSGYGGYTGGEGYDITSKIDVANFNLQFHPNTYLSFIVSKTTISDSSILVLYREPNWIQSGHGIYVSNASSPDTLTIIGLANKNNSIPLSLDRYNSNPPISSYIQTNYFYNIYCNSSDTTFYPLSY